ncbi:hypothetical protein GF326_10780 [Candidatus Bathyarchaeota archaeon]|nr:hypothetical protein [Candidatus Bathyarchaeota archaeon]
MVQGIRNRRKKLRSGPYPCLRCGRDSLRIYVHSSKKLVKAKCQCGYEEEIEYETGKKGIDYYNKLVDR